MERKSNPLPQSGAGYMRRRHRPIRESRRSHTTNRLTGHVPITSNPTRMRGRGRQQTGAISDQGGGEAVPIFHQPVILPPPVLPRPPVLLPPAVVPPPPVLPPPLVLPRPSMLPRPLVLPSPSVLTRQSVRAHPSVLPPPTVLPHPSRQPRPPVLPPPIVLSHPFVLPHPYGQPHPPVFPPPTMLQCPPVLRPPAGQPNPPVLPHHVSIPQQTPTISCSDILSPVLPPIASTVVGLSSVGNTGSSTPYGSSLSPSSGDFDARVSHKLLKTVLSGSIPESVKTVSSLAVGEKGITNLEDLLSNNDEDVLITRLKIQTDYLASLQEQRQSNVQYVQQMEQYLQSIQQEVSLRHQRRLTLGAEARKVSEMLSALRKGRDNNQLEFKLMASSNRVLRQVCQKMEEEILRLTYDPPAGVNTSDHRTDDSVYSERLNYRVDDEAILLRNTDLKKLHCPMIVHEVCHRKSEKQLDQDNSKQGLQKKYFPKSIIVRKREDIPADTGKRHHTDTMTTVVMESEPRVSADTEAYPPLRTDECPTSVNSTTEKAVSDNLSQSESSSHLTNHGLRQSEGNIQEASSSHSQTYLCSLPP